MIVLTTDEIDRELASRAKEVASMSATLVEMDSHAGLVHVRRYPPTGVTAQRWAVIENSLSQLWDDLGRMTSILESAQTLRARPIETRRRRPCRVDEIVARASARSVAPANPVGAASNQRSR